MKFLSKYFSCCKKNKKNKKQKNKKKTKTHSDITVNSFVENIKTTDLDKKDDINYIKYNNKLISIPYFNPDTNVGKIKIKK